MPLGVRARQSNASASATPAPSAATPPASAMSAAEAAGDADANGRSEIRGWPVIRRRRVDARRGVVRRRGIVIARARSRIIRIDRHGYAPTQSRQSQCQDGRFNQFHRSFHVTLEGEALAKIPQANVTMCYLSGPSPPCSGAASGIAPRSFSQERNKRAGNTHQQAPPGLNLRKRIAGLGRAR
jgi:hypothetical protein